MESSSHPSSQNPQPKQQSLRPSQLITRTPSSRARSPFPANPPADIDDDLSPGAAEEREQSLAVSNQPRLSSRPEAQALEAVPQRRVSWHSAHSFGPNVTAVHPSSSTNLQQARGGDTNTNSRRLRGSSASMEPGHITESSGDETTAIIGRERGRRRGYNTTPGSSDPSVRQATRNSRSKRSSRTSLLSTEPAEAHQEIVDGARGWWRSFVERYGTVELENKGSVARDHLSLERTFLAWLRTSLSFASIGIAVTQLFRLNTSLAGNNENGASQNSSSIYADSPVPRSLHHVGRPLGATFLGIGILTLFIGFHRYFESQHYVIMGKFPASRGSILLISFVAGTLIVASLAVILVTSPASTTS